jgi:hypothetical protein
MGGTKSFTMRKLDRIIYVEGLVTMMTRTLAPLMLFTLCCIIYKEDGVSWIKYADGHRRPVREVRYKCRTTKGNEDNPYLIIEVVPEGTRLAVKEFRMTLSPDGY